MKRTLAALIAIAVISGMAAATDTRIASIGASTTFLRDYSDIYFIPSNLAMYPKQITAELGTGAPAYYPNYGSASVTWTNNEEQTWGVMGLDVNHAIHGEDQFKLDITAVNTWIGGPDVIPHLDNKWHLFWAKKFGTMTAGLHLARAAGSGTYDYSDSTSLNVNQEASSGLWNVNLGLTMAPMENVDMDIAFAYQMLSFSGEDAWSVTGASGSTKIESDGGSNILFGARAFYGMSDELKLVPSFGLNMYNLGYKTSYAGLDTVGNTPEGGEKSVMNVSGAFGLNYQPHENVTILGGLHLGYGKATIEDTTGCFGLGVKEETWTVFTLPGFSAGVEAELVKWLWLRLGASKMISKTSTESKWHSVPTGNVTEESSSTAAPYAFTFGLGLKFGRLSIDAKLNDDQPFDLGYLISGNPGSPFTQVSATYQF